MGRKEEIFRGLSMPVIISELGTGQYFVDDTEVWITDDEIIIYQYPFSDYLFTKVTDKGNARVDYGVTREGRTVVQRATMPKTLYMTEYLPGLISRFRERVGDCPVCSSVSGLMQEVFREDEKEDNDVAFAMYGWLTGAALIGELVPIASEYLDEKIRAHMGTTPETLPLWARPSLWIGVGTGITGLMLGWKVFKSSTGNTASIVLAVTAFATTLLMLLYNLKARYDAGVSLVLPERVSGGGVSPVQKREALGKMKAEIAQMKQGFRGEPPATPWAEGIMERPWGVSAHDFEVGGKMAGRL